MTGVMVSEVPLTYFNAWNNKARNSLITLFQNLYFPISKMNFPPLTFAYLKIIQSLIF